MTGRHRAPADDHVRVVTIRFNAGNKPVTIVYSKKEVESLKNFITLDPSKPQK